MSRGSALGHTERSNDFFSSSKEPTSQSHPSTTIYRGTGTDCPASNASSSIAFPTSANFTLGTCFTQDFLNVLYLCTEDYLITNSYQSPNGCSGKAVSSQIRVRACRESIPSSGKKRMTMESRNYFGVGEVESANAFITVTCNPTAIPQSPEMPSTSASSPSSASSLTYSLVASLTIALLLGLL